MKTTNTADTTNTSEQVLYSVEATSQRMALPRTALYKLLMTGQLVSIKVGKHRLIPAWAISEFVQKAADEQRIALRSGGHEG